MLAKAGAILTGRLVAVEGDTLIFDDSAAANIAFGDRSSGNIRALIDAHIRDEDITASATGDFLGFPKDAEISTSSLRSCLRAN